MHHDAFFASIVSGTTNLSISSIDRDPDRYDRKGVTVVQLLIVGNPGMAVKIVDFFIWFPSVFPSTWSKRLPRVATQ